MKTVTRSFQSFELKPKRTIWILWITAGACFVFWTFMNGVSWSEDTLRSEQELEALQAKITDLQKSLDEDRQAEQGLETEIREIEKQQLRVVAERDNLSTELETLNATRAVLKHQQSELEAERAATLASLEEMVRARFILGRQDALRYLLDASEPERKSMNLAIYRYLIEQQSQELEKVKNIEAETASTITEVEANQQAIDIMLTRVNVADRELKSIEKIRQQRLNEIRTALGTGREQLDVFLKRKSEIELLLENLKQREEGRASRSISAPSASDDSRALRGFAQQQGKLPRPLDTNILAHFGEQRAESGLAWDGILFDAANGDAVRAVYNGQVIYSDWFYGYGQLLVLDHGDKHMSLYAHNRQLEAIAGDWVQAGESIAFAGSSGGLLEPALYFEIRVDGRPDDPLKWFQK